MKNAPTLLQRLLAWLPAILWAGIIFFLSAQPGPKLERLGLTGDLLSLATHFSLYAVLMILLVFAIRQSNLLTVPWSEVLAFILLAIYAFSDEYHQSFVPGRVATPLDWLTDIIGAIVVWVILILWTRRKNGGIQGQKEL
jgi:hypothetical protein